MGSTSRTMGCADSTDEKVEEKVEKTLEEQLADAEADLAAAESCRDENAENAGTVDDKKAAQEELEAKYNFWNQGNGAFWQCGGTAQAGQKAQEAAQKGCWARRHGIRREGT